MRPAASLFTKILCWFFLNLMLVAAVLAIFILVQPHVNLHAIFGQQGTDRLRAAGKLIAHDLDQVSRDIWPEVLSRHATIHNVDFTLILGDGSRFSSADDSLPEMVEKRARETLRRRPPGDRFPPPPKFGTPPPPFPGERRPHPPGAGPVNENMQRKPPGKIGAKGGKPHLMMRTKHPTRYWSGIRIRLTAHPPMPAVLLAASDAMTGHGFFFDPLPWLVVAAAVLLISVLLWIPMVRNITRPLARMTRATETISRGRFDVSIQERRTDEIGRLAGAINLMAQRLSAFVRGQKRFLGDAAHELGSPIARIQFGLGALEQRIGRENRQRVLDVMEDVDHMAGLVNELLAFSRADMKPDSVKVESIELLPVVQAAVEREGTPESNIDIRIDPDIRAAASTELLTRALANLVRNAIRYAGDAGPVTISATKEKDSVAIEVRDSGPGVPEAYLDRLFEPFFRPEPSRNAESGGVGLGLAIVSTCIEACHGTVAARNLVPAGFAVTVTLPV